MVKQFGGHRQSRREGDLSRLVRRVAFLSSMVAGSALVTFPYAKAQLAQRPSLPQPRTFNVPAQPLGAALAAFGQQSGLQVTADATLVAGHTSSGVSGSLAPEAALQRLLAGTGLTYQVLSGSTVALEKLPDAGSSALALPAVSVQGQMETAYGPGIGYVAHQSATATKTDTPLIETPQAISTVTPAQIQAQAPQTVSQALHYTSGVSVDPYGAVENDKDYFTIRGFPADVYLDGLKTFEGQAIEPYDLERIEVLHGPASVLYGQGNPGGLVSLISKQPTDTPLHEVELTTGSYGRVQGAFDLSGPLDQDGQFLYRITGLARYADTQVDHSKNERINLAPSFTWKPDDNTKLTVFAKYQYDPNILTSQNLPAQGTVLYNPSGKLSRSLNVENPGFDNSYYRDYQIGYAFEHRFNDVWTVRQNLRYDYSNTHSLSMYPTGFVNPVETIATRSAVLQNYTYNVFTLDNQAEAKFATGPVQHTLLFGVDYQHVAYWEGYGSSSNESTLNLFDPVYLNPTTVPAVALSENQSEYQVGAYAQDQLKLGKWTLVLSGREDGAGTTTQIHSASTGGTSDSDEFDTKLTYRAGLIYDFDNGLAPYVSYATSFLPNISGSSYSGEAFKPTTGRQVEVGLKYQPPGFNSFVTAAAYNLDEQNVLTSDPNHIGFDVQTGAVRSRGIELEAHASLTNNLNLIAAYTYLDATVTNSNSGTQGKVPLSTATGTAAPRNSGSVWLDYGFHDGPLAGLGLGGGVRYIGWTYGNAANTFKVPGYALLDLAAKYDFGATHPRLAGLRFQVNATNLTDKTYIAGCNSNSYCFYGDGRTVLATLRYGW